MGLDCQSVGILQHPKDIMRHVSLIRRHGVAPNVYDTELVSDCLAVLAQIETSEITKRTSDIIHRKIRAGTILGRPRSMTPEREAIATRMLAQGKRGKNILAVVRTCEGPSISQSAYYLWQKAWLDKLGS